MQHINTLKKLMVFMGGLVLAILGIFAFVQLGVAEMTFGVEVANRFIYPVLGNIIQWVAVVAIFVLVAVGIIAIIDYIHNHGKPDKPGPELTAINKLATDLSNKFKILNESSEKGNKAIIAEIRALRTELKGNRDDRSKE